MPHLLRQSKSHSLPTRAGREFHAIANEARSFKGCFSALHILRGDIRYAHIQRWFPAPNDVTQQRDCAVLSNAGGHNERSPKVIGNPVVNAGQLPELFLGVSASWLRTLVLSNSCIRVCVCAQQSKWGIKQSMLEHKCTQANTWAPTFFFPRSIHRNDNNLQKITLSGGVEPCG
ncbi:Protein of unknown function [Gryllus bimaculatus]|nr:Protein of unknown function [Gryllus bimaculatus]